MPDQVCGHFTDLGDYDYRPARESFLELKLYGYVGEFASEEFSHNFPRRSNDWNLHV